MSAENALGLFVFACLAFSGGAYLVLARVFGMWPFRRGSPCPVCGYWVDEGEEACETERLLGACRGCGAQIDPESVKRTCGSLECGSWEVHPWSGVDPRHGNDGNGGHG